jgi:hypothetical protein
MVIYEKKMVWFLFFFGIVWSIWNTCNTMIFNEKEIDYDGMFYSFFIGLLLGQNVMMCCYLGEI